MSDVFGCNGTNLTAEENVMLIMFCSKTVHLTTKEFLYDALFWGESLIPTVYRWFYIEFQLL